MSTNIGKLAATITADAQPFLSAAANVKKEAKSTADVMKSALSGAGGFAKSAAGFAGIPLDAKSLWSGFKEEIAEVTALGKEAAKSGLGLDTFVGLKAQGHDTDAMLASLAKFRKNLGAVHDEASDLASPFASIGLSGRELKKMSEDEALGKTFDALNRLGNGFTAAKDKSDIFGRGYAEMTRAIAGGSAGLENAAKYAKDFHLGFSKEDLQAAKTFKFALRDIDNAFAGIRRQAALAFAPLISEGAAGIANWLKGGTDLRDMFDDIARSTAEVVADMLTLIREMRGLSKEARGESPGITADVKDLFNLGMWIAQPGWQLGGLAANKVNPSGKQMPGTPPPSEMEKNIRAFSQGKRKPDEWDFFKPLRDLAKAHDDDISEVLKQGRILAANLREQRDTFGMAADAMAIYKLKLDGLPAAQVKMLEALAEENRIQKEVSGDWEKATKLIEEAVSPVETFGNALDEMNRLLDNGIIGADEWALGMKKATDQLAQFAQVQQTKLPEISTGGSASAFAIIARNEQQPVVDVAKQALAVAKQHLDEAKEQTKMWRGKKGVDLPK